MDFDRSQNIMFRGTSRVLSGDKRQKNDGGDALSDYVRINTRRRAVLLGTDSMAGRQFVATKLQAVEPYQGELPGEEKNV